MKNLPLGVKIYGTLFILGGILPACVVGLLIFLSRAGQAHSKFVEGSVYMGVFTVLGLPSLLLGIGLLRLKRWARSWTIRLAGVYVIWRLAMLVRSITSSTRIFLGWPIELLAATLLVMELGFCGFALWYFLRPSVKAKFQKPSLSA